MKNVRMTDELFAELGATRVDWGEPDAEGFYTPTVYASTIPCKCGHRLVLHHLSARGDLLVNECHSCECIEASVA